jgi:hypothetical protein
MAIELSNIIFTDQDDIVPLFGVEEIVNTGIANTLAGNDLIIGTANNDYGFGNIGTLNTDEGNDTITGIGSSYGIVTGYGSTFDTGKGNDVITGTGSSGLGNEGTLNTDDGNDTITGTGYDYGIVTRHNSNLDTGNDNDVITGTSTGYSSTGFENMGTFKTGDGNDIIAGTGGAFGLRNRGTLNTDDGNDTITGIGNSSGIGIEYGSTLGTGNGNDVITATNTGSSEGFANFGTLNTGDGQNSIISHGAFINIQDYYLGNGGEVFLGDGDDSIIITNPNPIDFGNPLLYNTGIIETAGGNDIITVAGYIISNTINTGNGDDSIFFQKLRNVGGMFLGDGNDLITADTELPNRAIENFGFIGTGDGNDIINSRGIIYNQGVIETGNGDDSMIVDGGVDENGTRYGIYNYGGAINTGNGNDSIIANEGFESAPNSSGAWFLGEGEDYIKGYGSGDFYGGNGFDTLELTPGTYTVGIWGEAGESPIFTKGNQLMITSEFEKLKAGSTIYDFTSLTAGQIIVVA